MAVVGLQAQSWNCDEEVVKVLTHSTAKLAENSPYRVSLLPTDRVCAPCDSGWSSPARQTPAVRRNGQRGPQSPAWVSTRVYLSASEA